MKQGTTESYSSRMHTGNRTYFFDVKSGPSNEVRLEVTESRKRGDGFQRNTVMVFSEDVARFVDELLKAVSAMGEAHGIRAVRPEPEAGPAAEPQRLPRLLEIKRQHPNAYERWTEEEEARLRKELADGVPLAQIARAHARQKSAVRSRIEKLRNSATAG